MTTQTKQGHTKGPWATDGKTIEYERGQHQCHITGFVPAEECDMNGADVDCLIACAYGKNIASANAHLIAAAPELLEACKYAIAQAGISPNSPTYIKLKQALEKAEKG